MPRGIRRTTTSPHAALVGGILTAAPNSALDPIEEAKQLVAAVAPPTIAEKRGARVKQQAAIVIPKLRLAEVTLHIIGDTPLIVHCWSKKAEDSILKKQEGKASGGKTKKVPVDDFRESLYMTGDGQPGFPASAFKACAVSAANDVELKQTETKRAFRVVGYYVPIIAPPHTPKAGPEMWTEYDEIYKGAIKKEHGFGASMRRDFVRLANGVADIRFRAQFPEWSVDLKVILNQSVLTIDQLVGLFNCAGFGCGVGEWRASAPESKSGSFGSFHVVGDAEVVEAEL